MSKRKETLRALVTERLTAAAEEIFVLVERTIAEYEEELCRSKEENQRKQQLLDSALSPQLLLHRTVSSTEDTVSGLKQENCDDLQTHEAPHVQVKEEGPDQLKATLHEEGTSDVMATPWEDTGMATETSWEEPSIATETTWGNLGVATEMATQSHTMEQTETVEGILKNWTVPLNEGAGHRGGEGTGHGGEGMERQRQVRKRRRLEPKFCSVCNKKFLTTHEWKRHELSHTSAKPYSCPVCKRGFVHQESVSVHMMLHTGEQLFTCTLCHKRFVRKNSLKKHVETIHGPANAFRCSVCLREFRHKGSLRFHMFQHTGNKPFCCSVCDKSYTRRNQLNVHMVLEHPELQQLQPSQITQSLQ